MGALGWLQDLVERVDVRFGRGDHDISIRALTVEDSAVLAMRTVTSPCASVPLVMLLTEYSSRSVPVCKMLSIALNEASTGPPPSAVALRSSPSSVRVMWAHRGLAGFRTNPQITQLRRSFSAAD
jgi:hypothetical protein